MIRQGIKDQRSRVTLHLGRRVVAEAGLRDSKRGGLAGALVGLREEARSKQQIPPVMLEPLVLLASSESRTQLIAGGVNHDLVCLPAETGNVEQPASKVTQRH